MCVRVCVCVCVCARALTFGCAAPRARRSHLRPVNVRTYAEEAKHHTDTFVSGYDERCAYDPDALPVGAMLSALHFSQGLFFRRVDCVALADGFAPERLMGFVPVPSVVNLGALREAKRLKAEADADEAEENRAEADKAEAEAAPAGGAPAPAC